jgi:dynein heavy chain
MGQGREEFADNFINQSKHRGEWVLLQNCHLGLRYMETLFEMYKAESLANTQAKKEADDERAKEEAQAKKKPDDKKAAKEPRGTSEDYRLWITTEVHPRFPISLLQLSLKLTNEPPAGAKASMKRTISSLTQQTIDTVELSEWRRLLYVLAFFNCTVQERRKFGPLGWAIPYEFNHSDFTASVAFTSGQVVDATRGPRGYDESFWQTVRYGICEIHYGGRVTDELDRRLIKTIGELYFNNGKIVVDEKKEGNILAFDTKNEYPIPDSNQVSGYIQVINRMPANDPPDVFGLHSLADVKLRRDQANEIFQTIIDVQPKESAVGGLTREDLVLQKIHELLPQTPEDFDMERVLAAVDRRKAGETPQPLDVCCKQEIERMQIVLRTLRTTLTDLELAIDGSIVMNDQLYNAMNSIYDGRIPDHWKKISWPAENLKGWFEQVRLRYDQYAKWIETGKMESFWLGGMFNPCGFLTSLRQQTCRLRGWGLNDTYLECEVQAPNRPAPAANDKEKEKTEGAVFVRGLFLEGARWGKGMTSNSQSAWGLTELQTSTTRSKGGKPVTDLRNEMPWIKIWPVKRDKANKEILFRTDIDTYVCPVYKNATRTDLNYVFDIPLKSLNSNFRARHWVMRGVCLTTI